MGWESVEALPGGRAGGAFRGGAEPVAAERRGISLVERARLFWYSTPEQPVGRTAQHVVVTPQHVYVKRLDGTQARVRLEELHGERLDRGRMIYGVHEDEDLLLVHRGTCAVQERLASLVGEGDTDRAWEQSSGLVAGPIFSIVGLCAGVGLLLTYPFARTYEHILIGLWTSETALGTYTGVACLLAAIAIFLVGPSRWQIDRVGLTRTRGVFPWFVFSVAPSEVRRMRIRAGYRSPKNGPRHHAGWSVDLELRKPQRIGSLLKQTRVSLMYFSFGNGPYTVDGKAQTENRARYFAERVHRLLALHEETVVQDVRPRRR